MKLNGGVNSEQYRFDLYQKYSCHPKISFEENKLTQHVRYVRTRATKTALSTYIGLRPNLACSAWPRPHSLVFPLGRKKGDLLGGNQVDMMFFSFKQRIILAVRVRTNDSSTCKVVTSQVLSTVK